MCVLDDEQGIVNMTENGERCARRSTPCESRAPGPRKIFGTGGRHAFRPGGFGNAARAEGFRFHEKGQWRRRPTARITQLDKRVKSHGHSGR
ncbi:hypothetical protein GCM10022295_29620 [Streptomyces osmaniensis]|uniref:Uncharacterized protein n=1 Tax=Streptomyces osmaniensis TaxID=593134 RepID=A0ABP6W819_9ACTN